MSGRLSRNLGNPAYMINHGLKQVLQYENRELQHHALSLVPVDGFLAESIACDFHQPSKCGVIDGVKCEICFLQALASWFKNDFFTWMNSPDCQLCGERTQFKSKTWAPWKLPKPRFSQINDPYIIEFEDHLCSVCGSITQFPRHTDVSILLETRTGRCSEWAQAFTLICRALGYRSRLVVDITDHVWTEIFSNDSDRWVHIDSCEAVIDRPLLYENGWGKRLSYVVGVGADDVQDVSWRYSADHDAMKTRRRPIFEEGLIHLIVDTRNHLTHNLPPERRLKILKSVVRELLELLVEPSIAGEYSSRTSGDKQWIQSRSEDGATTIKNDNLFIIKLTQFKTDFEPSPIKILYSSARDSYRIEGSIQKDIPKWQSLVYSSDNVFRNKENDWNMTYMARRSAAKDGVIEWRFDAESNLVTSVRIVAGCLAKDDCDVTWQISGDNQFSSTTKNVETFSVLLAEPCRRITVRVVLSSPPDKPEVAWQFAQIFREKLSVTDFSFGFVVSIKSP